MSTYDFIKLFLAAIMGFTLWCGAFMLAKSRHDNDMQNPRPAIGGPCECPGEPCSCEDCECVD